MPTRINISSIIVSIMMMPVPIIITVVIVIPWTTAISPIPIVVRIVIIISPIIMVIPTAPAKMNTYSDIRTKIQRRKWIIYINMFRIVSIPGVFLIFIISGIIFKFRIVVIIFIFIICIGFLYWLYEFKLCIASINPNGRSKHNAYNK